MVVVGNVSKKVDTGVRSESEDGCAATFGSWDICDGFACLTMGARCKPREGAWELLKHNGGGLEGLGT